MPRITLNGADYYYCSEGTQCAPRPTLVLLHGAGGDSSVWHTQLSALSSDCHLIAPDLPGHGRSGGSPASDAEHYACWLSQLTQALGLPTFVLAGHSMGGIIAQQFAYIYPEVLKALILCGTGMRVDIPDAYRCLVRDNFEAACMVSCRQAYAGTMSTTILEHGLSMLRRNGPSVLERDLALCAEFDSSLWAGEISHPCLVLCGAQDSIAPRELSCRLASAMAGSCLTCIENAGHMLMQEQPERFNHAIRSFITAVDRTPKGSDQENKKHPCPE
jgi:pimeloyl-ACP methyl ester carboxylesterase